MEHSVKIRKCAYLLADKHLSEMPDWAIVENCPSHYGATVSDTHRLFLWNGFVDHYLSLDEYSIYRLYKRHVEGKEPIIKYFATKELEPEVKQLLDEIVKALWSSGVVAEDEDENRSQYTD